MYRVKKENYYYAGTLYAPQDHFCSEEELTCDHRPNPDAEEAMLFDTIADAEKFLTETVGLEEVGKKKFSAPGTYYLSHGEYSRPVYLIRKVPQKRQNG